MNGRRSWIAVCGCVLGMFAPSATTLTPPFIRVAASLVLISFWVALGNAQSALIVRHLRQNQSLGCKLAPYLLKDFTAIASSSFTSKTV